MMTIVHDYALASERVAEVYLVGKERVTFYDYFQLVCFAVLVPHIQRAYSSTSQSTQCMGHGVWILMGVRCVCGLL